MWGLGLSQPPYHKTEFRQNKYYLPCSVVSLLCEYTNVSLCTLYDKWKYNILYFHSSPHPDAHWFLCYSERVKLKVNVTVSMDLPSILSSPLPQTRCNIHFFLLFPNPLGVSAYSYYLATLNIFDQFSLFNTLFSWPAHIPISKFSICHAGLSEAYQVFLLLNKPISQF